MAAFTKTTPGHPTQGLYTLGDVVTDSNNVLWTCTKTGFAAPIGAMVGNAATFVGSPGASSAGTVPAAVAASVSVSESAVGSFHRSVFTITQLAQAVVNGTEFQGTKIYTFPEGRIIVHGCVGTFTQRTLTDPATTVNGPATGAFSLGSATASNVALTGTMVDMAPSTAFTTSATINTASAAFSPVLAATASPLDGTATAIAMFLNSAFATTTDVDANGTIDFTGTFTLTWLLLGDK